MTAQDPAALERLAEAQQLLCARAVSEEAGCGHELRWCNFRTGRSSPTQLFYDCSKVNA